MTLPVAQIFEQLQAKLRSESRVILQAPPGAGKSTLLPLLLLKSGQYSPDNQILILEPRRVAARQIARYLAKQLDENVGQRIGLRMRGESRTSSETVVTIVTDGVMVRQLQADPELAGIGLVIFDEFHERALQTDLALALTLDVQELNEALKILIMSATLDLTNLSEALSAPIVLSEGRQFPVETRYIASDIFPSVEQIVGAVAQAMNEYSSSILVFLSGVSEIKRVQARLEPLLGDRTACYPLHGGLTLEQQSLAISPSTSDNRKVVLATNIAQTSLTIDGVDVVVDTGIEKVVIYQSKTANEKLVSQPVSIASSIQRMGRAGRLGPGICYRLGSKQQFERRRQQDVAEIERVDLAQLLLEVSLWGAEFEQLFWASQPPLSLIKAGQKKLQSLGFWHEGKSSVTELAKNYRLAATDLHLSRMLLLSKKMKESPSTDASGLFETACLVAAFLEEGAIGREANLSLVLSEPGRSLLQQLKGRASRIFARLAEGNWSGTSINSNYLGLIFAMAFPDRIGKRQGKRWKLSNGSAVDFHPEQIPANSELIIVVEYSSSRYGQYIQSYFPLTLNEVEADLPELLVEDEVVCWSEQKQQPQKSKQTRIGHLILREQPLALNLSDSQWQDIWCQYISDNGLKVMAWNEAECLALRNQLALVKRHMSHLCWPDWSEPELLRRLTSWLGPYINDVRSAQQLKRLRLAEILRNSLDWSLQQTLAQACPSHYQTPAGNRAKIDYSGEQPKLSVKLQEMFGEPVTPTVCNGKQALIIELLSPAKRPLQVTQDLQNFWQNAYTEVKKEMKGRYPKHPWPDDPLTSQATSKTKSQLSRDQKNKH